MTRKQTLPRCRDCEQVMLRAEGCTLPALVDGEGRRYARIRFGDAREAWTADDIHPFCGDCGARPGGVHHTHCDFERCPVCGGQLLSCTMCGWHVGERGILADPGPSHGGLRPSH